MRAICVKPDRRLEVREVATPVSPPVGHLLVDIDSCAINHGDKTFLSRLPPLTTAPRGNDVWGASGVGRVVAVGEGVPPAYAGRRVAMYRSLEPTAETIGLWCERAQVHYLCCLILPEDVCARDYCGSLVNVMTAYAFLQQALDDGHRGIVVTAGVSATGRALAAIARKRDVPLIRLVRSAQSLAMSSKDALDTSASDFEHAFLLKARETQATAIFDGLGGGLVGRLAPLLPDGATFYLYGFLDDTPLTIPSILVMTKNIVVRRFSNFNSATVTDPESLSTALADLREMLDDAFSTTIGQEFHFEDIDAAMRFEGMPGARAVIVP